MRWRERQNGDAADGILWHAALAQMRMFVEPGFSKQSQLRANDPAITPNLRDPKVFYRQVLWPKRDSRLQAPAGQA
jgi:hypothetical protein